MNIAKFLLINNFVIIFLLTIVKIETSVETKIAADIVDNFHHMPTDIFYNINQQYNQQNNDAFITSYINNKFPNRWPFVFIKENAKTASNACSESKAQQAILHSIMKFKIDQYQLKLYPINLQGNFYYTQDVFEALLVALSLWKLDFFMDMLIAFEIRWTKNGFQKNYLQEENLLVFKLMRPTKDKPHRQLIGNNEIDLFKEKFNQRLAHFNNYDNYDNDESLTLFTEQITIPPLFNSQLNTMKKHFFDGKYLFIEYAEKKPQTLIKANQNNTNKCITLEKTYGSFIEKNKSKKLQFLFEKRGLKIYKKREFQNNYFRIHQHVINFAGFNIKTQKFTCIFLEQYPFHNDDEYYQTFMTYNTEKKFFYNMRQCSSGWYLYKIDIPQDQTFQDFFLTHQLFFWINSMEYYDRPLLISHFFSFLCKSKIIFTYIILFFFKKHYGLRRIPEWFYSIDFFETINFKNRLNSDGKAYQEDLLKIGSFLTRFCLSLPIVYYFIKNTIKDTAICSIFYNGMLHILLERLWKNSDLLYYKWCAR